MDSDGSSSGDRWRPRPGSGRPAAGCETQLGRGRREPPRQLAGAPLSVRFPRPI